MTAKCGRKHVATWFIINIKQVVVTVFLNLERVAYFFNSLPSRWHAGPHSNNSTQGISWSSQVEKKIIKLAGNINLKNYMLCASRGKKVFTGHFLICIVKRFLFHTSLLASQRKKCRASNMVLAAHCIVSSKLNGGTQAPCRPNWIINSLC
jgi:hypothetical protein